MIISSNDNYSRVIMAPIVELNSLINSDVYNLSIQSTCSSPHFLSINIIQCLSTVKFHLNAASPLYLSTPHPLPLSLQTHTIPSLGPPGPRHCQYSLYYRHIAFYLIFNITLSQWSHCSEYSFITFPSLGLLHCYLISISWFIDSKEMYQMSLYWNHIWFMKYRVSPK